MRESFEVETTGRGLLDLTARVRAVVAKSTVQDGLATVFVHHTSASLLINENADPAVLRDLEAWMSRLVADGDPLFTHTDEGPDDMSAHVRSALTQSSLGVPVANGQLDLGTWQAIYLWEHRHRPHRRRVSVVVLG
ncbi:MAG: YjbQ family protein [Deltaproteobacteria bacterium]|nr:YjbQ family protein [Deltaproteobacteria bacterium]